MKKLVLYTQINNMSRNRKSLSYHVTNNIISVVEHIAQLNNGEFEREAHRKKHITLIFKPRGSLIAVVFPRQLHIQCYLSVCFFSISKEKESSAYFTSVWLFSHLTGLKTSNISRFSTLITNITIKS